MKRFTLFAIPVFVIILLLGGVFVWKMLMPQKQVVTTPGTLPNSFGKAAGNKPSNPFSALFGQQNPQVSPIPTPTPATAAAMNADVNAVGDDGGASDFASLNSDLGGL